MTTDIPQASKLDMVSTQKVLLIEDNPGDAALVQIYLGDTEFQGCEVIHKESLEAGLAVAREEENLLAILLDLKLPDSSGLPTLEKIVDAAPNSNIIVLTGTSDRELGLTAVRLGAQDYLVKGSFDESVQLYEKALNIKTCSIR